MRLGVPGFGMEVPEDVLVKELTVRVFRQYTRWPHKMMGMGGGKRVTDSDAAL